MNICKTTLYAQTHTHTLKTKIVEKNGREGNRLEVLIKEDLSLTGNVFPF